MARKSTVLTFRVTDDERTLLKRASDRARMPLSTYVREQALSGSEPTSAADLEEVVLLLRQAQESVGVFTCPPLDRALSILEERT